MKQLKLFCAAIALAAGMPAMADVTVGQLSRATGSQVIVDNLNQREWLGFDVTRNLTYAQALAATAQGGQFEGYKIATVADGRLFAAAAGGACIDPNYGDCLQGQPELEQVTGESYYAPAALGSAYDHDYAWLLSDGQYGAQVGFLEVFTAYGADGLAVAAQPDARLGRLRLRPTPWPTLSRPSPSAG